MLRLRPGLPIILCTGFSEEVNEKQALDMGVRAFLMKPFTLQELARTIRLALAQKARPDR